MAFDKVSITMSIPKPSDISVINGDVDILISPSRKAGIVHAYMPELIKIKADFIDKDFTAQELTDIQAVANMIAAKLKATIEK